MNSKGKKPSARAGVTRKRKRDARPQTRQSLSPSQSPSKRGRDAQSKLSPNQTTKVIAKGTSQVAAEPTVPVEDLSEAPPSPPSKAIFVPVVEDTEEVTAGVSSKSDQAKSGGTNPSGGHLNFFGIPPEPDPIFKSNDAVPAEQAELKKESRAAHGLVLHITTVSPSCGVHAYNAEEFVATPSPRSNGPPSPLKDSDSLFRTPTKSPSKLVFGVGFGSSSGVLSELPFYMDSPGKRYDEKFGRALASSPSIGSMGPPDSSSSFGSRSLFAFGTPESPTRDYYGSPSTTLGVPRRIHGQLLDSPSARAISDAIDQRDSEQDRTSWLRAGDHERQPRAALGTLYEKPATRVFGRMPKPLASPERKSFTDVSDGKADAATDGPVPIEEFLETCKINGVFSGNAGTAGPSQDLSSRATGAGDFYIEPGDGSPKSKTRRLAPLARPNTSSMQTGTQGSDGEESELELSDKENM